MRVERVPAVYSVSPHYAAGLCELIPDVLSPLAFCFVDAALGSRRIPSRGETASFRLVCGDLGSHPQLLVLMSHGGAAALAGIRSGRPIRARAPRSVRLRCELRSLMLPCGAAYRRRLHALRSHATTLDDCDAVTLDRRHPAVVLLPALAVDGRPALRFRVVPALPRVRAPDLLQLLRMALR